MEEPNETGTTNTTATLAATATSTSSSSTSSTSEELPTTTTIVTNPPTSNDDASDLNNSNGNGSSSSSSNFASREVFVAPHPITLDPTINILVQQTACPAYVRGRKRAALLCETACLRKVENWARISPPKMMKLHFYVYRPIKTLKKCPRNETKGNQERIFTPFDQVRILANFDPDNFTGPVWVIVEKKRKPTISLPAYGQQNQQMASQMPPQMTSQMPQSDVTIIPPSDIPEDQKYSLQMCVKDVEDPAAAAAVPPHEEEYIPSPQEQQQQQQQQQQQDEEPLSQSGGDLGSHQNPMFKVWRRSWSEVSGHLELTSRTERVEEFPVYEHGEVRDTATTNMSQSTSMSSCFRVEFSQGADIWIQKDLFGDSY